MTYKRHNIAMTLRLGAVTFLLLLECAGIAEAQRSFDIDLGIRGGVFLAEPPMQVYSSRYARTAYSVDSRPASIGGTLGLVIDDRIEVRVEAVRSTFRFHGRLRVPDVLFTGTVEGQVWQYPLLGNYRFHAGSWRLFGGGGFDLGTKIRGTEDSQTIYSAPINRTENSTSLYRPTSPARPAFYVTGGLEKHVSSRDTNRWCSRAVRCIDEVLRSQLPLPACTFQHILKVVEETRFEESKFFSEIAASKARALLIGRRALIALGLPLLTRDYDFWIHIEDVAVFNSAVAVFELAPTCSPEEAQLRGRYVLENDEKVDVLVARTVFTIDSIRVSFDEVWERRRTIEITEGVQTAIPSLDDLILTKRFSARPKDAEDVRMLETLRSGEQA